jgi:cytochrome c-type biogenesis protein CcmE
MKSGQLLGIALIAGCILVAGFALRGSVRQSFDVKEALASSGEPCGVYGKVVKGSDRYDLRAGRLDFVLRDKNGDTMPVVYNKPKPANFDQANDIKAVGAYRDGAFQADELFLKCPSKYITGPPTPGKNGAPKDPYAGLGKGA